MPGPPPKHPRLRQRTNKQSTAATLTLSAPGESATKSERPELPARVGEQRAWHPQTIEFWREVWASPMAAEYIAADIPGLVLVAELVDRFNYGEVALAAEIRLQRQCFGLTPLDRRRLQWEIKRVEAADRQRPQQTSQTTSAGGARDPRRALRAVK